jgi:DNA-binding NarL/FixJ family response regulator
VELAINHVVAGDRYLPPAIFAKFVHGDLQPGAEHLPLQTLSPRQREILQLIGEGQNTKEIAYNLNISVKTVETHRAELMARLNIRDVAELARYAIKSGIVSLD